MESLNDLYQKRSQLQTELDKITIRRYGDTPWAPGVQDSHKSNSYSYNEYTDESRARSIMRELERINDKINNYAMYAEQERQHIEYQREMQANARSKKIQSNARELYEQALTEYRKKSLIGKVGALFAGKRPKKGLTDKEIMQEYGAEAEFILDKESIEAIMARKTEEYHATIMWYKNNQEIDPERKKQAMDYYDYVYEREMGELQEKLEKLEGRRMGK